MEENNNIVQISGLWKNRFYSGLRVISEPIRGELLDAIEYCKKQEVQGGEFSEDAVNSLCTYLEALELLFPDSYADLMGNDDA